jgi:hypothetical protein
MVLGCICAISDDGRNALSPESVTVDGVQHGFVVSLRVTQCFKNSTAGPIDLSYIIPNNVKICLYDTTFRLRGEIIKPRLERKAEAREIFDNAKAEGRAAVLSRSLGNGLVEFELGNLPPDSTCEVEAECGFVSSASSADQLFFKFPLDTCTPGGSTQCATSRLSGPFVFRLRNAVPSDVLNIASNISGTFDRESCTYRIEDAAKGVSALFVTTTLRNPVRSRALSAGRYICGAAILAEGQKAQGYNEFVFVVDCSGSMGGQPIKQARECLDLFIRSIPEGSFFNVVRFGSSFQPLFPESHPYCADTVACAVSLAARLQADLGGTEILQPLEWLYSRP